MTLHNQLENEKDDGLSALKTSVNEHRAFWGIIPLFRLKRQFVKTRPFLNRTVFHDKPTCYHGNRKLATS